MKGRDRNLLILVVVLVSCFAALAILMSGKESKQNVLSPIVVPVRGWFYKKKHVLLKSYMKHMTIEYWI